MKWFRFYVEVLDDEKVQTLPLETRWGWVMLLCLAAENSERGLLPSMKRIAFKLRISEARAATLVDRLKGAGLIDETANGLAPHNWDARQYASDNVTDRVRKHRERKKETGVKRFTPVTDNVSSSARDRLQTSDTEASKLASRRRTRDDENVSPPEDPPNGVGFEDCIQTAMAELGDRAAEAIRRKKADFAAKLELRPGVVAWDCLDAAIVHTGAKVKAGGEVRSLIGLVMHLAGEFVGTGIPDPPAPVSIKAAVPEPLSQWQDLTNYEGIR